jgi:hypothetical protein
MTFRASVRLLRGERDPHPAAGGSGRCRRVPQANTLLMRPAARSHRRPDPSPRGSRDVAPHDHARWVSADADTATALVPRQAVLTRSAGQSPHQVLHLPNHVPTVVDAPNLQWEDSNGARNGVLRPASWCLDTAVENRDHSDWSARDSTENRWIGRTKSQYRENHGDTGAKWYQVAFRASP